MAGFGASHQGFSSPKKSSVNFYIRLFCTIAATAGKIVNHVSLFFVLETFLESESARVHS